MNVGSKICTQMRDKCQKLIDLRFDMARLFLDASHYLSLIGHLMAEFVPQDIVVRHEPDRALRIVFIKNSASKIGQVDLNELELKDALICYYRNKGIDVAISAKKKVQALDDEVIMTVHIKADLKIA